MVNRGRRLSASEETESAEGTEPGRAGIPACLVACRPQGLHWLLAFSERPPGLSLCFALLSIAAFPVACQPRILSACRAVNPFRTLVIRSRDTPGLTCICTGVGITQSARSGQSYNIFSLVYIGQE